MKIGKWGSSLAVRLPMAVVKALKLEEGDQVDLHIIDAHNFGVARKPNRDELLTSLRRFRGRLPADFRFDREAQNTRH